MIQKYKKVHIDKCTNDEVRKFFYGLHTITDVYFIKILLNNGDIRIFYELIHKNMHMMFRSFYLNKRVDGFIFSHLKTSYLSDSFAHVR